MFFCLCLYLFHLLPPYLCMLQPNHPYSYVQRAQTISIYHAVPHQTHIQYPTDLATLHFFFYPSTSHHNIHLTIILSALFNLRISSTFVTQVSLPYTITLCTHALYIFPFNFREAPFKVKMGKSSLNLPHAHLTRVLDDSSAPPPFPTISPK